MTFKILNKDGVPNQILSLISCEILNGVSCNSLEPCFLFIKEA